MNRRFRHVRSPTRPVLVPNAMEPARTTHASTVSPRMSSADRRALVRSPRRSATPKKMSKSDEDGSSRLAPTRAKRALFPSTTASPRANAPISPVEQASRMLRATTHRTFASSALASTPSPRDEAATNTTPTKTTPDFAATTPMSKHVRTLVKNAMTSLTKGRSRLEELVKSHGRGLNFSDAGAAESPVVRKSAPSPTVSATTSSLDREAAREATEMLLRSAKKLATPKKALRSPLRSPAPVQMDRVVPGVPMSILADSTATESMLVQENQVMTDDAACDEEVTSQPSLPPGFDASAMLNDEDAATAAAPVSLTDDIVSHIDVFARMMGKVISDTIEEISASLDVVPVTEIPERRTNVTEPTTPSRRSSRRKSVVVNNEKSAVDPTTPSRRSGRSKDPVTPSRRSKRVASRGKK
jgi:hypothetical protein